jgi:hypothetical protein
VISNTFGAPPLIKARIPFSQAIEDFVTERDGMGWHLFHQRETNLQRFERCAQPGHRVRHREDSITKGRRWPPRTGVYAQILRNEEIDRVDIKRVQECDIDLIVRLRHGAELGLQIGLRWLAHPLELFELSNLAKGDGAALGVAVATYVLGGALMDEYPDAVLGAQLLQGREFRGNFPLVFKTYEDVRINEELAAAHSL